MFIGQQLLINSGHGKFKVMCDPCIHITDQSGNHSAYRALLTAELGLSQEPAEKPIRRGMTIQGRVILENELLSLYGIAN